MAWSVLQSVCCSLLVKLLRGLLRGVAALRDTATVLQCSMRAQTTRSLILLYLAVLS